MSRRAAGELTHAMPPRSAGAEPDGQSLHERIAAFLKDLFFGNPPEDDTSASSTRAPSSS